MSKTGNAPQIAMTTIYDEGGKPSRYSVTSDTFTSNDERRKRHSVNRERRIHGMSKRERRETRKLARKQFVFD